MLNDRDIYIEYLQTKTVIEVAYQTLVFEATQDTAHIKNS